ncbi:MAG: DHH family phosphoesterase [Halodesulfurarchaeum sp.]
MVDRLVLGCGELCLSVIGTINEWDGEMLVLDSEESRIEHLRDLSISAEHTDVTDPTALEAVRPSPETVIIFDEREARREAIVAAARSAFPDAHLQSLPVEAEQLPDRVFSPGEFLVSNIIERLSTEKWLRLQKLRDTLRRMSGQLAICTHDNPDPDALGAALGLRAIAERFDIEAEICYFGEIAHQENRAFVNLLEVNLRRLEEPADLEWDHLALVDHSRPGTNNSLPPETPVDIVIDHHPTAGPPEARFVDLRSETGATSTLLVEYLQGYDIRIETAVATGLLYGIRVDTRDFGPTTTAADLEAAAWLLPRADIDALRRIESPSISPQTLETIAKAIENRRVDEEFLTSFAGEMDAKDSLAQAADRLLNLEGVSITVVYGYNNGTIHVSGRASGDRSDLGELFRRAFDSIGSAGGHESMAGAQIPMGIFEVLDGEKATEGLHDIIQTQIEGRLEQAREHNS